MVQYMTLLHSVTGSAAADLRLGDLVQHLPLYHACGR